MSRVNSSLSAREREVLDRHGVPRDGIRVPQWEGASSVYFETTGRLWVHNHRRRKNALQEFYFHSADSVCGTLTGSHPIKLWDLRRRLMDRELARLQGFPEEFLLPSRSAVKLFGNAVCVPCAEHACSRVLDGTERTHIDLCAGIGGFHIAARNVVPSLRCVGFSEIHPSAIRCYTDNFPDTPSLGDATALSSPPECDLLTAGFPCQPFSNAYSGKRGGAPHPCVDFFETVLECVERSGCSRVVLENVPNFVTVGMERMEKMVTRL